MDPFEYISLNSHHKNTLKFHHTYYARTESFKYTVFNRFPAYFDQLPQDHDQLLFSISGFLMNQKKKKKKKNHFQILARIKMFACNYML